jgi:hypothetical protein
MASVGVGGLPFVIAGSLKIVYDLLLYRSFRSLRPPEEMAGEDRDKRPGPVGR